MTAMSKNSMSNIQSFLIVAILFCSSYLKAEYVAEVREIGGKDVLFKIEVTKTRENGKETVVARSSENGNVVLEEVGVLDVKDFSVLEYRVDNRQTKETGKLIFNDSKIWIEYRAQNQSLIKKEIPKPKVLIAPANFEQFLKANFETLKKTKTMPVDFLIWDRHETINFKISYLGEKNLNGEKTHHFKMNVNNFLIAAFISPIQMWYSEDMTKVRRFLGRVAVKKKNSDGSFSNLDADVTYKYN
jgi:hypothetical protein